MHLLDQLLSLVAPHSCLGCSKEGSLLCPDCAVALPSPQERCYRCQEYSFNSLTCADCLRATPLIQVCPVTPYSGVAKQLVGCLKYDGAVAAAKSIGQLMSGWVNTGACVLIVPVPTSNARRRQRGYDQAELLARVVANITGQTYARLLARHGERHQVGANRLRRQQQLRDVFRVRRSTFAQGRSILLIDDVVTTGATLEAAAGAINSMGASEIKALTFAQA